MTRDCRFSYVDVSQDDYGAMFMDEVRSFVYPLVSAGASFVERFL